MPKPFKRYICTECKYISTQWMGKCTDCESWNSFEEESTNLTKNVDISKIFSLDEIGSNLGHLLELKNSKFEFLFSSVLDDCVVMFYGEPGIGKSTLLLEISKSLDTKALYICGEESLVQVKGRCHRLGISNSIYLTSILNWSELENMILEGEYNSIFIDSIQTLHCDDINSLSGSPNLIRHVSTEITAFCKRNGISCFMTCQVNKAGDFAGPKSLKHIVDISVAIENNQDGSSIRVTKSRYSKIGEIKEFKIKESGIAFVD